MGSPHPTPTLGTQEAEAQKARAKAMLLPTVPSPQGPLCQG